MNIQERSGQTMFGRISNIRNRGQASPDLDFAYIWVGWHSQSYPDVIFRKTT